jgi:DNA-directed RNA polymerase I subunit RPA2
MAPAIVPPSSEWSVDFDTVRRGKLFTDPPSKKTAFPALREAVQPHISSFNAIFEPGGLIELALEDIGTKTVFDGAAGAPHKKGNRIDCKLTVFE